MTNPITKLDLESAKESEQAYRLRLLGLARRQGGLVFGAGACERALYREPAARLILARDAGRATRRRFTHIWTIQLGRDSSAIIEGFTAEELGQISGRERQAVAVLLVQGIAERIGYSASPAAKMPRDDDKQGLEKGQKA